MVGSQLVVLFGTSFSRPTSDPWMQAYTTMTAAGACRSSVVERQLLNLCQTIHVMLLSCLMHVGI